ncbi:CLUMA_CG018081, isoform A [Clunio marinus]|uniref:CLUMA_CG018081, isoform A n=1 Tax=Clunio marinus TaxID=568069 RepID=A0A1J1IZ60_9DIPT|nr:CLUMA_CG018081, isoform A [Clunio marinus]
MSKFATIIFCLVIAMCILSAFSKPSSEQKDDIFASENNEFLNNHRDRVVRSANEDEDHHTEAPTHLDVTEPPSTCAPA